MTDKQLDWDTLKVFRTVAELGSMSAAATSLGDSPPTISRRIDELEKSLGVKLLNRTPRGVEVTEAGEIALRHSKTMMDAVSGLLQESETHDHSVEGRITLACGDGIGPYWIAPKLPAFQILNRNIHLNLLITEKAPELLDGAADIAIEFEEPKRNDVVARRLGTVHYTAFASDDYIKEHGVPSSIFEFHTHKCILYQGYVNQVERWAPKIAQLRKMIDFALVTNSASAMVEVCAHGGGVAVLPSFFAEVDKRLVPLDLPEAAPIHFWLTYKEKIRRTPHGKVVIDWIRSQFDERNVPWFSDHFVSPRDILGETEVKSA